MTEFTYEFPDGDDFLEAIAESLKRRDGLMAHKLEEVSDLLRNARCQFRETSDYSNRANAYWAEMTIYMPKQDYAAAGDLEPQIGEIAREVFPPDSGYDLRTIHVVPEVSTQGRQDNEAQLGDRLLQILIRELYKKGDLELAGQLVQSKTQLEKSTSSFVVAQYTLILRVPPDTVDDLRTRSNEVEAELVNLIEPRWSHYSAALAETFEPEFGGIRIEPDLSDHDPDWRKRAIDFLEKREVTNQGRAHSQNVAHLEEEGLLFRSRPEIHVYHALKSTEQPFAPLPVFVRGGTTFGRIEPDFLILWEGNIFFLEVDGEYFHDETPVEADKRVALLKDEGCDVIRVEASECDTRENAKHYVDNELIPRIQKRVKSS